MKPHKKPILFLLGPTASGKTDWAINWQIKFEDLEIISVDSVMVYKECNVGSAKPSNSILKKHPHHLVNHVSLNCIFSVADFYQTAMKLIDSIHGKNKVPCGISYFQTYHHCGLFERDSEIRVEVKCSVTLDARRCEYTPELNFKF